MLYFGGQPWAGEGMPVQRLTLPPPPPDNQWAKAFVDGGRGIHAETVQSALTVILKLVTLWLDHCHLDYFRYSSEVGSFPFFEVNS